MIRWHSRGGSDPRPRGAAYRPYRRSDAERWPLAESIIGLYKTELVDNLGPWQGVDDLEWATLEYVDWFNHRSLMGKTPPAERKEDNYRHHTPTGAATLKT